jgi:ABC-2 type transport system permease protein
MRNVWIVAKREFMERVRTRSFIISTLAFPLLMSAMFVVPAMIGAGGPKTMKVAVVSEAPAGVAEAFRQALADTARMNNYQVELVPGTLAENHDRLVDRVRAEELDGYVVLPADVVTSNAIQLRARSIGMTVEQDIERAASQSVQAERLRVAGVQAADVRSMLAKVEASSARITKAGEESADAGSTFMLGYFIGFMVYLLIILYGVNVLRSVLEEKTNRIVEVIISSMRAEDLMRGKVLGVASVALLQVGIWAVLGILVGTQAAMVSSMMGASPDDLAKLTGTGPALLGAIAFFLVGFLLYSALFAALGAAVNSEQEAQQMQTVVFMPLIVPMLFIFPVINDPLGTTATILGMIPFTAPVVMPMRMAAAPIPLIQILGSLALLVAAVFFVTWLAGKIYRVGILSTGKKPTLPELIRWMKAA